VLPNFRAWAETNIGLKIDETSPAQEKMAVPPVVNRNEAFLAAIAKQVSRLSFDDEQRAFHAHGHSCQEVYTLRFGSFTRVPDVVVWPGSHAHVEAIVRAAIEHNVVIIPYGGGTTVTHALLPPDQERRMVVSLDMHDMNKLKWVNKTNMLACFEAGIIGKEIEETLNAQGLCFGHEPDSHEFSSLGGWVATRASGMKKNVYGNIEDMIVGIKFVTPQGVLEKNGLFARISNGPDLHEVVLGSEGTLGVVTEVTIKVRPLPAVRKYGSVIFPDFASGYRAMQEVGLSRAQPASIRLMDNPQFQFGQALKPAPHSSVAATLDKVKKLYVTKLLGFDVNTMTAVTLMFEGSAESVRAQEKKVYSIMAKHGGRPAGEVCPY
jgi:alkyldihydroxyacetonephosphate synthase